MSEREMFLQMAVNELIEERDGLKSDLRKLMDEMLAEGKRLVVIESDVATGYYQCAEKIKKLLGDNATTEQGSEG